MIFIHLCYNKVCSYVNVRLLSCLLAATVFPQYQRQVLRWWEWLSEDFSLALFGMPNTDVVLSCILPCPKMYEGQFAFSHCLSSVLCILWVSAPIKCCPKIAFPLSSALCWGFLPSVEFRHIWESLFVPFLLKSLQNCCSQWAMDFAVVWKTVTKLWGWT